MKPWRIFFLCDTSLSRYCLHHGIHPGRKRANVIAQILDDRSLLRALREMTDHAHDDGFEIRSFISKPGQGLDDPHGGRPVQKAVFAAIFLKSSR